MQYDIFNGHPAYNFFKIDLKKLLKCLSEYYPLSCKTLSLALLTESTICTIHQQFLKDKSPTDVITFPLMEYDSTAEICVSVDQAVKISQELEVTFISEITLYIVHGWLHLFGYDDKNSNQCLRMRHAEQEALSHIHKNKITT